jgi:FkbM family methyltransferase
VHLLPTRLRRVLVRRLREFVGGPGLDWTMERAMARIARGHRIATIVDVGASDGRWTLAARRLMTGTRALLIEAQADPHESALRSLQRRDPAIDYVIAAAGDRAGETHFDASDPFGGAVTHVASEHDVVVPMTTIDHELIQRSLPGPYLIKLDTHGFEREILAGAKRTLETTAVLVIEAYNFELQPGVLRFHELCGHLEGLGFRPIDIADPMRRPKDAVLWQMDLVFARSDRPEFADAVYS